MARNRYHLILFIIFILFFKHDTCLFGQKSDLSPIHNYPMDVYEGDPQNWCIAEDHRGVMYFANQNGVILEYDGVEWRKIQVPELTSVRSLAINTHGTIYVGTVDDFGYLSPDPHGNIRYISILPLLDSPINSLGEIWSISIKEDEVYFQAWEILIRLKNNKIKIWHLPELYHRSFVVNNQFYIRQKGLGITTLKKDSFELINGGEQFSEKVISAMLPFSESKILIGTRNQGLFIYNPKNKSQSIYKFNNEADNFLIENKLYHGVNIGQNKFAFSTLRKGIISINTKGEIEKKINRSHSLLSDGVYFLHNQNKEILWAAQENGISKILINSPFQFLNKSIGSAINNVIRFNNKLYLATGQGVVYIDSTETLLVKNVHNVTGISGSSATTWHFLDVRLPISKTHFTNKLLFASTNGLYELNNGKAILLKEYKTVFVLHAAKKDPTTIFVGYKDGVQVLKWHYKTKSWTSSSLISDFNTEIRYICEDEDMDNAIWFITLYNGVYRLVPSKILTNNNEYIPDYSFLTPYKLDLLNTEHGFPSTKDIIGSSFQGNAIFPTEKGLYKYNKSSNHFTLDSSIHPILAKKSTTIFRFKEDAQGNVWINSNMIFFKQADNSFIIDTLSLKKISSMRIDAIYPEENGITWFAGDGLYRYDSHIKPNLSKKYPVLIRIVTLNKDSVIFGGTNFDESNHVCIEQTEILKPIIKHQFNSISFKYTAIFFEDEKNLEYSYMLENFDTKWSQWSNEIKKEYTNLFEGKYTFKVKAKNVYDIVSTVATYSFEILPPFYRTSWAYAFYILLFASIMYLGIKINARRLKAINIRLEKQVKERTAEIRVKNKELAKLSIVASKTDNAIAILDADANFEWINAGFTRLHGYTLKEYIAEKGLNLINSSTNSEIKEIVEKCIKQKKPIIYQSYNISKSNEKIWTQITLTPVTNNRGKLKNLITIESDIRKIKEYEEKIKENNEELIQQKEELATQRDALAEANATKDKFFAIISHDLRSPFNSLLGFGEIVLENMASLSKEKLGKYIDQMYHSSKQLFNLVENLLEWSRSKRGVIKSHPEELDLLEITNRTLRISKMSAGKKKILITINIGKNIKIFADENLISTVIRNLISNAIKYSEESGSIVISSKVIEKNVEISITDSGVGIKKKDLKKLFREEYHFTTRGTNQEKGTGLGLILCKEFTEILGGQIWVESEEGKGTTFTFTIPLSVKS